MSAKSDLPVVGFATVKGWEQWLADNHDRSPGLWLKIAKAGSGTATVTYKQALEAALCYGWIDGQKAALDESFWLQRFTPRKPDSAWSKINREKAEELIEQGRMRPPGLAAVEAARARGTWDRAYASQSTATVPADLQAALDQNPQAASFFASLDGANRYAILYRIHAAKRPETRAARIEKFIAMLNASERIHEEDRPRSKTPGPTEAPARQASASRRTGR